SKLTPWVISKHADADCLAGRGIPEYLDIQIGDNKAAVRVRPGPVLIPVACIELQEKLGDSTIPKLRDRCLLQSIKPCLPVIDMTQGAERQGKDGVVAGHIGKAIRGHKRQRDRAVAIPPDRDKLVV